MRDCLAKLSVDVTSSLHSLYSKITVVSLRAALSSGLDKEKSRTLRHSLQVCGLGNSHFSFCS